MSLGMSDTAIDEAPLGRVRVVLCRPSHPGNVGGAARAAKVMGMSELALVRPRDFPGAEATARATGAADVLDRALVVDSLGQALSDRIWAVGFTARSRQEGPPVMSVSEAAAKVLTHAQRGPVAIVFGNERTGLVNDELVSLNALARIPTGPSLSSLNLAAAVQVACWEVRRVFLERADPAGHEEALEPASRKELDAMFQRVWRLVARAPRYQGKADDARIALLRQRFEQLTTRAQPTSAELKAVHGVLSWLE